MIKIHGLDHIVLRTTKLDQMLHFYQTILGCQLEREFPQGLTQLRAGNALIDIVTVDSELGQLGGKAPEQDGRNVDHFCLQITPVDEGELATFLDGHNIAHSDFAKRYGAQGFGRSVYLDDPEGNVVELKPYVDN
ncbi:VOC family protein [Vibrio fluvialis]|uniref:VOC family protein n=1 Tax=Vibrio TaxID=662 RepID=UPI0018F15176|nr:MULTISPECIES: VOC family protein [Vibrio]EKO3399844.1 VOC family protein [Vibrio fluvialis]MBY8116342.1 VOC family protein [Vibrio fluvialis]MBY8249081.1 VOC family protein [Vibrio fluvialis]MBY8283018.1 VOC family protein [Vibrio fluvialis]MCG6340681.1 VOC family protein [Vibrio fluvialis]